MIDGVPHVLERPLRADVALGPRARGPTSSATSWYRRTARNFNPVMATAADLVIAEVGELVPVGAIEPEAVHTPHLYVDSSWERAVTLSDVRGAIAARAARELRAGEVVNLGIGIPNLIAGFLGPARGRPPDRERPARRRPAPDGRRGRPGPHRRRQAAGDRAARGRVLRQRGLVRDDPRRSRGRGGARRAAGQRARRHRELGGSRPGRARRGWGDGPRRRREARHRDDDAPHSRRRAEDG